MQPDPRLLQSWIASFPAESIERLRLINATTGSSKHIILSLAYGLYDKQIRALNRMITQLLLARMKAERRGKTQAVKQINDYMEELHEAIDAVTKITSVRSSSQAACSRPTRIILSSG